MESIDICLTDVALAHRGYIVSQHNRGLVNEKLHCMTQIHKAEPEKTFKQAGSTGEEEEEEETHIYKNIYDQPASPPPKHTPPSQKKKKKKIPYTSHQLPSSTTEAIGQKFMGRGKK